jgi:hypothetical protein
MDANQNPPSERDWTEQEKDEFYASQDAVTGMFNGFVVSNDDPMWTTDYCIGKGYNIFKPTGIHITSIVSPESGWPIVAHCDLCRKTVIVLSPWAIKPEKGDYWKMHHTCLDEDLNIKHNMYPQRWYPWKETK